MFGGHRKVEDAHALPDLPLDEAAAAENKTHVEEFFPFIKSVPIDRMWTGLMPFTPDGEIVVGKLKTNNLGADAYIISGMASSGIMMGAGTAKYLVDMICGCPKARELLKPADPNRFCAIAKL